MIASTTESIQNIYGFGGLLGVLCILAGTIISIAAITISVEVRKIRQRATETARTLAAMASMMRNGK